MAESVSTVTQLPKWKSHKEVEADKIVNTHFDGAVARTGPNDSGYRWTLACGAVIPVSLQLIQKLPPGYKNDDALGGYYIRYADGSEAWSKAPAFEEGYSLHTRSHHAAKDPGEPRATTPFSTGGHRKVKGE